MAKWKELPVRSMPCWHCNTELIWGGDHDIDPDEYGEDCPFDMVTNLSCPSCESYVEVYHRKEGHDDVEAGQDS